MTISALPLERIITEAVLQRLDAPDMHDALAGRAHDDTQAQALAEQVRADTEQLQELTDMYVERAFSEETAGRIRGLRPWLTSEYEHNALRADGARLLGHLIDLARGRA